MAKTEEEIAAEAAAKKAEEVTLSQTRLEEIINESFAKGAKNGADPKKLTEMTEANEALKTQQAELQTELDALKKKSTKPSGDSDDDRNTQIVDELTRKLESTTAEFQNQVEALKKQADDEQERRTDAQAKLQNETLRNSVLRKAADLHTFNPDEVFTLMKASGVFRLDEESGDWRVVSPDGKTRIDVSKENAGNPLPIDAAVAEFVNQRTHLVQPSGRTGSGQGTGTGTGVEDRGSLPALPEGVDPSNLNASDFVAHRAAIMAYKDAGGTIVVSGSSHN